MASQQGIRAGSAFIELFVNDDKLIKGLNKASKKLKAFGDAISGWGKKLAGLGTAVTAPLIGFAKVFASGSKELQTLSQKTGISVGALSELAYAAQLSGTDMETLEVGIKRMQKSLYQAATGSQAATDALAQLGLTVADLRGLSPDQQFKLIADKLAAIQSPAVRAAMAMQFFGKSGTQLLPMMAKGAAGIEAMQSEARNLGLTATETGVAVGVKLEEALTTLWKVLKKLGSTLGSSVAPLLTQMADRVIEIVVKAIKWVKQNKELVVTIFKVAAGVVAAGLALVLLGKTIVILGTLLGSLATVVSVVGTAVGVLGSIIAALLSPIGLVMVAVAALGACLLHVSGAGGKALAWLGQRFTELYAFASEAFRGIADALMAGDIALAAKILWLTLKVVWIKGVGALESAWLTFRNTFIKIAYDAFYGAQATWEVTQNALCVAWIETTAFMSKVWSGFTSGFMTAWNTAINWTSKRMLELQGMFDSSLDVDAAKKLADQSLEASNKQIDEQKTAALSAREQQRAGERKAAAEMHDSEMTRIGQEANDKEKALDDAYNRKVQASQEELDKTRQEWKDAIGQAGKERRAKDAKGPGRLESPSAIPDYLEGLGPTLDQAQKHTIGVHGTFSAAEARRMGAGGANDRLTQASEATAKNTKKILDALRDNQAEFD